MAEDTPYARLTAAIHAYGSAALENFLRCRAFAHALAESLHDYLGAPEPCVSLVPAKGPFDPKKAYGEKAFSYDPARPIRLEPITFGLCVTVPNAEDSGSMWIRTAVMAEVKEDRFEVFVAGQPRVRVPLDFEGNFGPVHETLMTEYMRLFRQELEEYGHEDYQNRIGFVPIPPSA
jgi:hypothetical protein